MNTFPFPHQVFNWNKLSMIVSIWNLNDNLSTKWTTAVQFAVILESTRCRVLCHIPPHCFQQLNGGLIKIGKYIFLRYWLHLCLVVD